MADGQYSINERLINAASNLLLTVFLAAIVRLAFGPGARTVSYYLLACPVALIFIQDTLVTLEVVGGPNATIGRALAPAIYVFFGAAAMHPDRHLMTEPPREFDVSLSWRRITPAGRCAPDRPGDDLPPARPGLGPEHRHPHHQLDPRLDAGARPPHLPGPRP